MLKIISILQHISITYTDHRKELTEAEKPVQSVIVSDLLPSLFWLADKSAPKKLGSVRMSVLRKVRFPMA